MAVFAQDQTILTNNVLPETTSPLIAPETAAAYLRCNPRTLAEWRIRGRGPRYVRAGRRAFYRKSDLDTWLEAHVFIATADEHTTTSPTVAA